VGSPLIPQVYAGDLPAIYNKHYIFVGADFSWWK